MLLTLRLICHTPPSIDPSTFGLQDKKQRLTSGTPHGNTLIFTCEVEAREAESGEVDFTGAYVHGTKGNRFLYLSFGNPNTVPPVWIMRIKVPLNLITPELITAAQAKSLTAEINGRKSASAAFLKTWHVTTD